MDMGAGDPGAADVVDVMLVATRNARAIDDLSRFAAKRGPPCLPRARRAWRGAARPVQLRLGRGLDSRIVLEELLVQLDVALPLIGRLVFGEDRLHRAHRFARATVDALVRVDVEHRLAFIDAI